MTTQKAAVALGAMVLAGVAIWVTKEAFLPLGIVVSIVFFLCMD